MNKEQQNKSRTRSKATLNAQSSTKSSKVSISKMTTTGRPTIYTEKLGKEICRRLCDGLTLEQICRDDDMPNRTTIYNWRLDDGPFLTMYRRARLIQTEIFEDQILAVAHDGSNDWYDVESESGVAIAKPDRENVNRSKLRVDTMKWVMSKRDPKQYGDRQALELHGEGGGALRIVIEDVADNDGGDGNG